MRRIKVLSVKPHHKGDTAYRVELACGHMMFRKTKPGKAVNSCPKCLPFEQCRYPDCKRDRMRGYRMCARHRSASGVSLKRKPI